MHQMSLAFTDPNSWIGGSIDALMFFGDNSALNATEISRGIWSFPDLEGPYLDRTRQPDLQSSYDYTDYGSDGFHSLLGVLKTHDDHFVPFTQSTIVDDDGLWIYAGPTMGGLPRDWDVGAYPFDDGKSTKWLPPLIRQLRDVSSHVSRCCPMLAATYGWLTLLDVDIVMEAIAGKIPEERWAGISVWRGDQSIYYPPTQLRAPMRKDA